MNSPHEDMGEPPADAALRERIAGLESLLRERPHLSLSVSDPWLWLLRAAGVVGCVTGVGDLHASYQPEHAAGIGLIVAGALLLLAGEVRAGLRRSRP